MKISPTLLSTQNPWRDAATLLLCCPIEINGGQKSIAFLVTKRSKQSKFMPGGYCFPGGTISPVDYSSDWLSLYKNAGIDLQALSLMSKNAHRPPIYTDNLTERIKANLLPQEVSLKLTAIRETFEECGVLISNSKTLGSANSSSVNPPELQDEKKLVMWQDKVKENPEEFLNLCKTFSVLPDLTALYEWSNWLTPTIYQNPKRRFDTLFYIACVPHKLNITLDSHELETAQWATASYLVKGHEEGEHQLLPPQYYEMTRLRDVHSLDDILKLGLARRQIGFERWLPDAVTASDGLTSILPGDDLYSKDIDSHNMKKITNYDVTNEELLKSTSKHHRFKFVQGMGKPGVYINIKDRFGQFYSVSKIES